MTTTHDRAAKCAEEIATHIHEASEISAGSAAQYDFDGVKIAALISRALSEQEQERKSEPYCVDLSLMIERCHELACEVINGTECREDTVSRAYGLLGTIEMHGPAYAKAHGLNWKPRNALRDGVEGTP